MNTAYLIRLTQTLMTTSVGLYTLIVAVGNVTDYSTNFLFVKHVMSMDTTFEGNRLMYRAITAPAAHHAAYILIIAVEWFIAVACCLGSWQLAMRLKSDYVYFREAKKWGIIGLLAGIMLWFFGFQVLGGEWFAMWQSDTWNGLDSAFRLSTFIGITLVALLINES